MQSSNLVEYVHDTLHRQPGGVYVDCTLGGGGHTKAILERGGRVIACDQDTDAILYSSKLLTMYLDSKQLEIIQSNFRDIKTVIPNSHIWNSHISSIRGSDDKGSKIISIGVDGVLMDLGISSHQIDYRARGFSFGQDGPLDMRMDQSIPFDESKFTAATIVNEWNAEDIANLLYQFGDETRSRSITRAIIANRPITTTTTLTEVISRITAWKERPKTLARCFQALRIAVNNEMDALDTALNSMHHIVKPGKLKLTQLMWPSVIQRCANFILFASIPYIICQSPFKLCFYPAFKILSPLTVIVSHVLSRRSFGYHVVSLIRRSAS